MKFELNEFHRNTSNDELISDVRETANKLGKVTLTASDYKLGKSIGIEFFRNKRT